jgi:lysine 2,3-aminomutase
MPDAKSMNINPPSSYELRGEYWRGVTAEQWGDWHWQMKNLVKNLDQLRRIVHLTADEEEAVRRKPDLKLGITPHFAALMDPDDPQCPIRLQVVPTMAEFALDDPDLNDPLGEDAHMPVPGLVHRYPDRVLVDITDQCVAYCRHCTRRRLVGTGSLPVTRARTELIAQYLEAHPEVRDALISGGDGFFIADDLLEYVLKRFRSIKSLEIIRFGTRVPIFLPQRITDRLLNTIKQYHPIWVNIHINHPKELTPEVREACARLADVGIPLGSQTVLLAGINDCPNLMKTLVQQLVQIRVRPYYIYQCDLSQGIGHFRTPVSVGLSIVEALRGHTSGFAVPTFVVDAPGGGGKIPVMPNYLLSMNDRKLVLRNFEGVITTYTEAPVYYRHNKATCEFCQKADGTHEGVARLLEGEQVVLEPEGLRRKTLRRTHQIDAATPPHRQSDPRLDPEYAIGGAAVPIPPVEVKGGNGGCGNSAASASGGE